MDEAGLSREGVAKIREGVRKGGISAAIDKLEDSTNRKTEKHSTRGRPGISSLEDWLVRQRADQEPVVEVVLLALSSTIKCAVIGLRAAGSKSDSQRRRNTLEIQKRVNDARTSSDDVSWTSNGLDFTAEFLFIRLKRDAARRNNLSPDFEPQDISSWEPLLLSYKTSWRFVVLHEGDASPFDPITTPLKSKILDTVHLPDDSLLEELEKIIYRLRVHENLQGLLPAFDGLRAHVLENTLQEPVMPLLWSVDEGTLDFAVRRRQIAFYQHGICGLLFELPLNVRKMIVQKESFPIATLAIRPRIKVYEYAGDSENVTVEYMPIPEMGYRYTAKRTDNPTKMEQELRKVLRKRSQKVTLEYSVRIGEMHSRTAYPEEMASERWRETSTQRVAVVSIIRQWLMEPPSRPLEEIESDIQGVQGAGRMRHNRMLVFHIPQLLEGVRAAFQANSYGDRLAKIRKLDEKLRDSPVSKVRHLSGWSGPLYYFSPDELAGKNIDIRTLRRLADSSIDYGETKGFGNRQGTEGVLHPTYNADSEFNVLLREYDADFLLRELDEAAWQNVVAIADEWATLWMEVISEAHWQDGKMVDAKLYNTIRPSLRREAATMVEDIRGWTSDALSKFVGGARRVLRHALEMVQRCLVANVTPICAVVRSEQDLLRSWKSYLGRHLNGRIVDELERRGVKVQGTKVREAKRRRKQSTDEDATGDLDDDDDDDGGDGGGDGDAEDFD